MVSANETSLGALRETFDREDLACGVRKGEDAFSAQVDQAVRKGKTDGNLRAVLAKWLPSAYLKCFQ